LIRLTQVSKQFGGKKRVTALEDISLEVARGEMVSIIGPSGSGKSTLLNLIGGLDQPTSGEIHIDGQSIARLTDDELTRLRRDKIGFIFQFFNLMPSLTCLQNVALPLHLRGWPKRKIQERSRELLNSPTASITSRTNSPAASASAWPSRGPWRLSPPSCWPTSPPATSIRAAAPKSST
jgi:putative ABC transport system ATP-binding protein